MTPKRCLETNTSTPLHIAAKYNNLKSVKWLLAHGADVNAQDASGSTPILLAIISKKKSIVECLLKQGAQLLLSDNDGFSPLHAAVGLGCNKITAMLLLNGACVNSKTIKVEFTPLHIASKDGNVKAVNLLLKYNAEIDARTKNESFTPLFYAIQNRNTEVAELLIDRGSKIDEKLSNGKTFLSLAIDENLPKVVEKILNRYPDVENKVNRTSFQTAAKEPFDHKETIEILLRNGFCIEPENVKDFELLRNAIKNGYLQIIEDFFKHGLDLASNNENINDLLHLAIVYKQPKAVEILIAKGADVNRKDLRYEKSPLYHAVQNCDVDIVNYLIQHGAVVRKNPELLHIAAEKLCQEVIQILLENHCDIDATNHHGYTALHIVLFKFLPESYPKFSHKKLCMVVEMLLNAGADINAKTIDGKGNTPLHIAAESGSLKIIQLLLANKANVNLGNKIGVKPVHIATRECHIDVLSLLLENGAQVNTENEDFTDLLTPLHIACDLSDKSIDFVKLLLKHHADVNCFARYFTPLHVASRNIYPSIEVIRLLLNAGANPNAKTIEGEETPLHIATSYTYLDIIELLLANKANVNLRNSFGETAVYIASEGHKTDVLRLLLENGAEVNYKDNNGNSPLHVACSWTDDSSDIVEILLKHQAEVDCFAEGYITPLHIVAQNGNLKIVKILLENQANVNLTNENGETALHMAIKNGNIDVLRLLLEHGAEVNCNEYKNGLSPLHLAIIEYGVLEIIQMLLEKNADVNATSYDGKTPLHFAILSNKPNIVKLLLLFNADNMTRNNFDHAKLQIILPRPVLSIESDEDEFEYEEYLRKKDLINTILKHAIALNVAKLYNDNGLFSSLLHDDIEFDIISHRNDCSQEIVKLESVKIISCNISAYSILTMSIHCLANYANNEDIIKLLKSIDFKTRFPNYFYFIRKNFKRAIERRPLIDGVYDFFDNILQLPYVCVDQILSYLSCEELKNINDSLNK